VGERSAIRTLSAGAWKGQHGDILIIVFNRLRLWKCSVKRLGPSRQSRSTPSPAWINPALSRGRRCRCNPIIVHVHGDAEARGFFHRMLDQLPHRGLKKRAGPFGVNRSHSIYKTPRMPTRCIASRSAVMPSGVMVAVGNHPIDPRPGGIGWPRNACSSVSRCAPPSPAA